MTSETLPEYTGGIARYIENILPCLKRQGVSLTVVARTTGKSRIEEREAVTYCFFQPWCDRDGNHGVGRKNPSYPYNVIGYWPGLSYQAAEEIKNLLRTQPAPDAIEVQDYGALGYFLMQEKLLGDGPLRDIPVYIHLHGPTFDLGPFNHESGFRFPDYWIGRMERFTIQAADGVLSPSRFLAQRVAQVASRETGITIIPYALPETLAATSTSNRFSRDLFYFGRIELRKGVRELVAACEELWRAGLRFRLRLAGADTEWTVRGRGASVRDWLERRHATSVREGRLVFEGPLHGEPLWDAIRSSRAVVIPSLWENFPNTCIEAMTMGRPVVVSTTGGQSEMVQSPGTDGFVFDWSDPATFRAAVEQVLARSDAQLEEMGLAARGSIQETCNPDRVGRQRIQHIEGLRERGTTRRRFPSPNPEWNEVQSKVLRCSNTKPVRPTAQPGKVSVVIPYFNLPDLLPETLDSIAASDEPPCEILIVNDGSTDERSTSVLEAAGRRPGVRVIDQLNQGLAAARNTGAREAQGEFLCFVDADDAIESTYLRRCLKVLSRYENVGFVYSWVQWFENTEEVWPAWQVEWPYFAAHNMLAAFAVVRRQVFLDHGYNQRAIEYALEDWEGWLSIYEAGWLGVSIPEPLVRYRIRAKSMMRSFKVEQTQYLYRLIAELHPLLYSQYGQELFLLENANGPARLWNNPALSAPGGPEEALATLSDERERIWEELQVLAKAWEQHVAYIRLLEGQVQESAAMTEWSPLLQRCAQERDAAEMRNSQLLALVAKRVQSASDWDAYVGYKLVRWIKSLPGVRPLLGQGRVQRWVTSLLKL